MLKKTFKWIGIVLILFVLVLIVTVALRQNLKFDAPYPEGIAASKDSAILARGKYIVYGPAHCANCHGAVGTENLVDQGQQVALSGGKVFDLPIGKFYTKNITSDPETGIGKLTDAQIARSLRYGVGYDGRAILDFMPFHNISDQDLTAIISYLRTIPPVQNKVPQNAYNLLGKIIKAFLLKPTGPSGEVIKSIDPDTSIAYGKYLATSVADCRGCHTNRDLKTGAFIGPDFSGGLELEARNNFIFHTPNLTPDKNTGHITSWSQDDFLKRFRKGKAYPESPMPWGPFSRMSDSEIKAIFNFLKTVQAVDHKVPVIVEVRK